MTLDELKQELQGHFAEKMVTVAGSGLSVALGLPSMGDLATALLRDLPSLLDVVTASKWRVVANDLHSGVDLETALSRCGDEQLDQQVRKVVAKEVGSAEKRAMQAMFTGALVTPFSRILNNLTFSSGRAEVITPNYDRLIEFGAELAGYGVDTTFTGVSFGTFNVRLSKDSLSEFAAGKPGRVPITRKFRRHVVIYKPHGSLDWYLQRDTPVRCSFDVDAPRLMITPGANKYRLGYNSPFDSHREAANKSIDVASRFLIVGYGFNDDQLEQHLRAKLRAGYPALVLTRDLTRNALKLAADCPSVSALCRSVEGGVEGSLFLRGSDRAFFPNLAIWDLDKFASEVLGV